MSRLLITVGLIVLMIGLLWPWLSKLGLGKLPGDIVLERENFKCYVPITTSIIISVLLSILTWMLRKL